MNLASSQQPLTILQTGPPVQTQVVQAAPTPLTNQLEKYKTTIVNLGIAEIVLGGIIFILDIAILIFVTDMGQGIWCGSFLIASGIVAVLTRSQPSYCMMKANIALSILAAVFMAILIILSGIYAGSYSYYYYLASAVTGLQSTNAVLGFAGFVIAIVHSAYCCAGVCCLERYPRQAVPVVVGTNGMMPVQLANGQTVLYSHPTGYTTPYTVASNSNVNTPTTQVSFTKSMQPNSMTSVRQPVQSSSIQALVYSDAPQVYTSNSQN